jgi:hypothetical protein
LLLIESVWTSVRDHQGDHNMADTKGKFRDAIDAGIEKAKEATHKIEDEASEFAHEAGAKARDVARNVGDKAKDVANEAGKWVKETGRKIEDASK